MDATYDLHAAALKVLADRRRLEIVHLLGTGPRDTSTLASAVDSDEGDVCRHLAALIAAGLVEPRPTNGTIRYGLSDPDVMVACEMLRGVLRRRLGLARHLASRSRTAPAVKDAIRRTKGGT